MPRFSLLAVWAVVFLYAQAPQLAALRAELPLPIAELKREEPVDFAREILPLLQRKCVACHRQQEAEGGLVLESIAAIHTGGDSGPAIVPGDAAASLLLARASGAEEPLMPPEDNSVGAEPLSAEELGLLKLWIQQGAAGTDPQSEEVIQWQAIPESIRSVFALDVSPDGRLAAIGRANRVVVVQRADGREVAQLVDPQLDFPGVADVDMIQSIAFSPDGQRIATGGFRTVRIWKQRPAPATEAPLSLIAGAVASNDQQTKLALVNAIGDVEIWDSAAATRLHTLTGHADRVAALAWGGETERLFAGDVAGRITVWDTNSGSPLAALDSDSAVGQLAAARDGLSLVKLAESGKAELFRYVAAADAQPAKLERVHESLGGIEDATAVALIHQPALTVILASESQGVVFVDPAENKLSASGTVDHGAVVESLAVSADQTQLATGGRDGKLRLWNLSDKKPLLTLAGTAADRLRVHQATQDATRQTAIIAQLNARTAELEAMLKKEDEALAAATEALRKAQEGLAPEQKKHADALALVTATEAMIAKATADAAKANESLVAAQKKLADAQATVDRLQKELEQAAAAEAAEAEAIAAQQAALKAAQEAATAAQAEIDAATKAAADAKTLAETSTKALEPQKAALTAAQEAMQKSVEEVAKYESTLAAATAAQQRATAAIPAHQQLIAAAVRRGERFDRTLAKLQQRSSAADNRVVAVAFHPNGTQLGTVHEDGSTRIYNTADGAAWFTTYADRHSPPAGVAFVGEAICRFGIVGGAQCYSTNSNWQLERKIGSIDDPTTIVDRVTALDFHRDGLALAVGSGSASRSGEVKLFAVETGALLRDFGDVHSDTVLGLEFSPDGKTLASAAADRMIHLLDVATGSLTRTLEGHTHHVLSLSWQDQGRTIASASADQTIRVWDSQTGETNRTISGFPKELTAITFVPATTQVLAACGSGQVRLAETSNGSTVRNFDAAGDFLYTVSVSADGQQVVAGGESGNVRIWKLADGALITELP